MNTLYRFFDADDTLLYVGMTINPGRRLEKHRATQPWWPDVARIDMEQHPDEVTLRRAEREAIKAENPLHNVRMNGKAPGRVGAIWLIWNCDVCASPISDGYGYVTLDERKAWDVMRWYAADDFKRRQKGGLQVITGTELMEMPDLVPWTSVHYKCDPSPESDDYWIDVARIRTPANVMRWTAHLSSKNWWRFTHWDDLLYRIAHQLDGDNTWPG